MRAKINSGWGICKCRPPPAQWDRAHQRCKLIFDSRDVTKNNHRSAPKGLQLPVKTSLRALSAEAPSVLRAQQLSATLSHRCPGTFKAQRYVPLLFFFAVISWLQYFHILHTWGRFSEPIPHQCTNTSTSFELS